MAPYRLLEHIDSLPYDGVEPLFVLDTSAVIDLEEQDLVGLQAFLSKRDEDLLVVSDVLLELRRQHTIRKNRRLLVQRETLDQIEALTTKNAAFVRRVHTHPEYDAYRYLGRTLAHELCCEKKRERDPFSIPDSHTLAFVLTVATHADEFGVPHTYPVLLTADEHLIRPIMHLINPLRSEHRTGYDRIRILTTRP